MLEMQWAVKAFHHAETYFNVSIFNIVAHFSVKYGTFYVESP